MSDIELIRAVEAAHVFASRSRARGDGRLENTSSCTCGHQWDWTSRTESHRLHVLAELAKAVREQIACEIAAGISLAEKRRQDWIQRQEPGQALKYQAVIATLEHTAHIARGDS